MERINIIIQVKLVHNIIALLWALLLFRRYLFFFTYSALQGAHLVSKIITFICCIYFLSSVSSLPLKALSTAIVYCPSLNLYNISFNGLAENLEKFLADDRRIKLFCHCLIDVFFKYTFRLAKRNYNISISSLKIAGGKRSAGTAF